MDRKKTILTAVLINAGLLVLLFVVAWHHDEPISKNVEIAGSSTPQENQPLFNDTPLLEETPIAQNTNDIAQNQLVSQPSSPVVYQLPPLASQEVNAPLAQTTISVVEPTPQLQEVMVKKGDNLEKIAKAHRTSVDEIIRINQLPSTFLRIGQVLKLPLEHSLHSQSKTKLATGGKSSMSLPQNYHIVKVGDNPWTIAAKHHMKVEELLKLNSMNEEKARHLKPGDRLRIR